MTEAEAVRVLMDQLSGPSQRHDAQATLEALAWPRLAIELVQARTPADDVRVVQAALQREQKDVLAAARIFGPPAKPDRVCIACEAPEGEPHQPWCTVWTGTLPRRDEILPGPRLVCGCPLDSGCDGRHPGALGSASGYDEK